MKLNIFCLLALTLFFAAPAFAQTAKPTVGAAPVHFVTKSELHQTIPVYSDDLRKTVYLILRADKAGLAQYAALQYHDLWLNNPQSASLKAEYAFSHAVAVHISPIQKLSSEQKRLLATLNQYFQETDLCRDEALVALPSSPEVALMTAWSYLYTHPGPQCIPLSEKAVALDPKWSLAHYRLAYSLISYHGPRQLPNKTEGLTRALSELKKAESLMPTIRHENILYDYANIYEGLKQYDKSLVYLNQILEANARNKGGSAEREFLTKWKTYDEAKLKAAQTQAAVPKL